VTLEAQTGAAGIGQSLQTTGVAGAEAVLPSTVDIAARRRPRRLLGRVIRATLLRWGISPYLLLTDVAAIGVGILAAGALTGALLVFALVLLGLSATAGAYRSRLSLAALDQAPDIAFRAVGAAGLATALGLVVGASEAFLRPVFIAAGVSVLASTLLRSLLFCVVRTARRRGLIAHPTLVLGAGQVGKQITNALLEHPEYGLKPIGFVDSDPLLDDAMRPAPLLGGVDALSDIVLDTGARDVIIAFSSEPSSKMVDIIRTCDRLRCEMFIVPRLFELHDRSGHDVEVVWGMPLLRMREAPFRLFSWRIKRLIDVAVSAGLLSLLWPVLALCALGSRIETGRGVIFRQVRVGLDGRAFSVMKFCSMRPVDNDESATRWSIADDDRVGPIGRFLRASSLDELPQLWNVLRGDMSLVGPRPERPHFVDQFATTYPRYMARHRVPCGITGWAQVHGLRGDTSIADRARFDNYYIENWSLWLDLKIVVRTIAVVLTGQGR
jgi:exopolysaccharide biosynthesis polyprenyl glycosylphosphotransferase